MNMTTHRREFARQNGNLLLGAFSFGRWSTLLVGLWLVACTRAAPRGEVIPPPALTAARLSDRTVSLLITGQLHNTTEPCGCTSEPLGDVARIAALWRATAGHGLLIDAGGLRYSPLPLPPQRRAQARLKADFLEQTWRGLGGISGLQPSDLAGAEGAAELGASQRLACNIDPGSPQRPGGLPAGLLRPSALQVVAGIAIGLIGIADPGASWPNGIEVHPPAVAVGREVAQLRAAGAQAIVAITGLGRDGARRLAGQLSGLDLIIAGGDPDLTDGLDRAEQVGSSLLVVPGIEGQRLVRVDLHLPAAGDRPNWELRLTANQQQQAVERLRVQQAAAEQRLATLRRDPDAEPAFVNTTAAEVARLSAALRQAQAPAVANRSAGYVTVERVDIRRQLPRDPAVGQAMLELDRRIGEANLLGLSGPAPAARPGEPAYVGLSGCQGACHFHDDAIEFWQKTHHAQAFQTLITVGKQLSYDCVGCHVAGFDEAGGANLWSLAQSPQRGPAPGTAVPPDLRNVQCEACHGPGSLHAGAPSKHKMSIGRPTEDRCLVCHTKDHSDTFSFVPYLRDILGPGHGGEKRAALGTGPTGHELRSAALNKQHSAQDSQR
jgi:hypothetical protein